MPKVKYLTSVRKDLLNRAVNEYLSNHPEEVSNLREKELVYCVGVREQPLTNKDYKQQLEHGPEWEGWRDIPLGKHKTGDWVVGHICSWRGTKSEDEEKVPECSKEIPPYKYDGHKYEQYCCNLHGLFTQAAYTIEEIKHSVRLISGIKDWKSPMNVYSLSVIIERLEEGLPISDQLSVKTNAALVILNHPIMQAKYPRIYTKELIDLIKEYRKMPSRIAKMVKADIVYRQISPEKTAYIYGLTLQEVKDAIAST